MSFEVPVDKIGEIIGPKGKVINAIQQETGADVNIDDDGTVGTVTIGAKQRSVVDEARRRIELILDPPTPEVGAVYPGRVVNITKFGAFVNILPGRDGLIHISRLGQGRRVERVEDVVTLGQEVEVRVDEIDPQGKVSLSFAPRPPRRLPVRAARLRPAPTLTEGRGVRAGVRRREARSPRTRPGKETRPAPSGAPRSRTPSRASSSRPSATSVPPTLREGHLAVAHGAVPRAEAAGVLVAVRVAPAGARGAGGVELSPGSTSVRGAVSA